MTGTPAYCGTPDPAFRRAQWRMLLAVMGCYLFYYCGRQNLAFANTAIRADLGLDARDVGVIGGGMLLAYGVGQGSPAASPTASARGC